MWKKLSTNETHPTRAPCFYPGHFARALRHLHPRSAPVGRALADDSEEAEEVIDINHIYQGDCIEVMKTWPADFVDTIITDPPYGLDFMGKDWDGDVPGVHFWQEMLRVCKPGALLLSFGGTRTWHHLASAIEKAGWEIRDCLMWLYGSGFPKSLDISKAIDKAKGAERTQKGIRPIAYPDSACWGTPNNNSDGSQATTNYNPHAENVNVGDGMREFSLPATDLAREWNGWGTALKPAWEPIIVAMKPLDGTFAENAEKWGVAGINVDGGRIEGKPRNPGFVSPDSKMMLAKSSSNANLIGYESPSGRWPANLILDEEAAAMLDGQTEGTRASKPSATGTAFKATGAFPIENDGPTAYRDSGGASRFFYVAKSAKAERNEGCEELPKSMKYAFQTGDGHSGKPSSIELTKSPNREPTANNHPTVKPLSLMKYLCLLTKTPTCGIVLDPFAGSGTTLWAAEFHNRPWIGIEMNPEYVAIANARIARERGQLKMAI